MFLFQLKQEKTRSASAEQPAQKCRDGFMVEQRGWIGCDVIDKENIARRLPAEKLKEIKAFYSEFVSACVSTLKEKGIDGSDIPIAWAEISSFLWSNFTFAGTGLLSEAFEKRTFSFSLDLPLKSDYPIVSAKYKEDTEPLYLTLSGAELSELKSKGSLVKTGSGVTYKMDAKGNKVEGTVTGYLIDCDTSALVAAEIFRELLPEKEINIVSLPNHAIINIGGKESGVYIETTVDAKTRGLCLGYYESAQAVIDEYETTGNAVPFSEYSNAAAIASRLISDSKYAHAISILDEAIRAHPNFKGAYGERADCFSAMKRHDLAILDYEKALEIDPSPNDFFLLDDLAREYEKANNLKGAIGAWSRLIDNLGGSPHVFANRAEAYAKLGKYKEAFSDFSKAISLAPSDSDFYSKRAKLRLSVKDYFGAIQDLSHIVSFNPLDPFAFISRAKAYTEAGMYESAKIDYRQASSLFRKKGDTWSADDALKEAYRCAAKAGRK